MKILKKQNKPKADDLSNELESLLGAALAPVSPRGEFVHQLQQRLESRFDPKPLLVIPTKVFNFVLIGLAGLIGGIVLTALGVKWMKRAMKSKWNLKENEQNKCQSTESQLPAISL